jgi:hypothetical protein
MTGATGPAGSFDSASAATVPTGYTGQASINPSTAIPRNIITKFNQAVQVKLLNDDILLDQPGYRLWFTANIQYNAYSLQIARTGDSLPGGWQSIAWDGGLGHVTLTCDRFTFPRTIEGNPWGVWVQPFITGGFGGSPAAASQVWYQEYQQAGKWRFYVRDPTGAVTSNFTIQAWFWLVNYT